MEILEPGKKNRVECQDCGAKLQFAARDIVRRVVHDPYDGPEDEYSVKCPSCKMTIVVTGKITSGIAKIIAEREKYEDYDL